MQIHEITRRQISEAVPGGMAAQAGVAGTGFLSAMSQKLMPGSNISQPKPTTSAGMQAGAAHQINQAAVQTLAQRAHGAWTQTLKQMVARTNTPAIGASGLDPQDIQEVLTANVNQLLGFNATDLSKINTPEAKAANENLANATKLVFDASTKTPANMPPQQVQQQLKKAWIALAQSIMEAQNAKSFSQPTGAAATKAPQVTMGTDGKLRFDGQPFNPNNPAHVQMQQAMLQQAGTK